MTITKVRLTIDSSAGDELARAKLVDLHQIVVDHVMRLKMNESVKVTIEYGGADLGFWCRPAHPRTAINLLPSWRKLYLRRKTRWRKALRFMLM